MNKNLLRSILLIITYSVVLVLVLVKIDLIWAVAAQILGALKPLCLGFPIAFVLNRPCTFFFRLYHGGLAGRKLDRFSRPLAVLSAYVALVVVVTALFSFVLPQVQSEKEGAGPVEHECDGEPEEDVYKRQTWGSSSGGMPGP